jgi:ketosteroid isomerase-like protein
MGAGGNAEVIRAVVDAWNRSDVEGMQALVAEDAVLRPIRAQLEGTEYSGRDGVRRLWDDVTEDWEDPRITVGEIEEVGDRVVARTTMHMKGRESGIEIDAPLGWLIDLRDGEVVRLETFSDPDDAYRAAGLAPRR